MNSMFVAIQDVLKFAAFINVFPLFVVTSTFVSVPSFLQFSRCLASDLFGILDNFFRRLVNTGLVKLPGGFVKKFNSVMHVLHPLLKFFIAAAVFRVPVAKFLHSFSKFAFEPFCLIATPRLGVLLDFPPHGHDVSLKLFLLSGKTLAMLPFFVGRVTVVVFPILAFPFSVGSVAFVSFSILVTPLVSSAFFFTVALAFTFLDAFLIAISAIFSTAFFILILDTRSLSIGSFLSDRSQNDATSHEG